MTNPRLPALLPLLIHTSDSCNASPSASVDRAAGLHVSLSRALIVARSRSRVLAAVTHARRRRLAVVRPQCRPGAPIAVRSPFTA
ncbi:hypothetical protein EXIGLDRAFT_728959 [Exidia glandulosa HHB12029]|uniref:Uncharacterized protein n=1 Tax=Exidia glandulosa HHB12029 TaxID=1314781 RepID=A0A165LPF2_EXIGL|nr:hypothetical protein EXIGLDRAFT_728959 [Exidia glandulosa HHB12029]